MVILACSGAGVEQSHPQEVIGDTAVGLAVDKVAPAADELTDQKAQRNNIQHGEHRNLLDQLAVDDHTQYRADYRTVDGDAALPDVENADGIGRVLLPFKDAVVNTGADNGKGSDPQHTVQKIVFGKTELGFAAQGIDSTQHKTQSQDHTVQVDGQRADGEAGRGIDLQTQTCKINNIICHQVSSLG